MTVDKLDDKVSIRLCHCSSGQLMQRMQEMDIYAYTEVMQEIGGITGNTRPNGDPHDTKSVIYQILAWTATDHTFGNLEES